MSLSLHRLPAIGMVLSLLPALAAKAHEGHEHAFSGVPLWQIAAVAGPGSGHLFRVSGLAEAAQRAFRQGLGIPNGPAPRPAIGTDRRKRAPTPYPISQQVGAAFSSLVPDSRYLHGDGWLAHGPASPGTDFSDCWLRMPSEGQYLLVEAGHMIATPASQNPAPEKAATLADSRIQNSIDST